MEHPTPEAAASLGLHPANLLLFVAGMGAGFEDVWPSIDEEWIEATRQRDWARFGQRGGIAPEKPSNVATASADELPVNEAEARIIEKLWRADRWGNAYAPIETIQKHTHMPTTDIEAALSDLVKRGLVIRHSGSGPYSLNPSKKDEVTRIANAVISRKQGSA